MALLRNKADFLEYFINCNMIGLQMNIATGENTVMMAARLGLYESLKVLIDHHLGTENIKCVAGTHLSAFHHVDIIDGQEYKPANQNRFECFKLLLTNLGTAYEINPNVRDMDGNSIFLCCIIENRLSFLRFLIENNGQYGWVLNELDNDVNNYGENGLIIAAKYSSLEVLIFFLEELKLFNNKINDANHNGLNPLLISAWTHQQFNKNNQKSCKNYQCFVKLLSQPNIDTKCKDRDGNDVIKMCEKNGKTDFISHFNSVTGDGKDKDNAQEKDNKNEKEKKKENDKK